MKKDYSNYLIFILIIIIVVIIIFLVLKNINKQNISLENLSSSEMNIAGCQNKESCIEYCSIPANNQKCANFVLQKDFKFFPFSPGNCQTNEECNEYCRDNKAECDYYANYTTKTIENIFNKNYSDIIIPVNSPEKEIVFYKLGSSHFFDSEINKEFENFKDIGINSYSFGFEVSYILGDVAYDINNSAYGIEIWPGYFKEWKSRASYLIGKAHLNELKSVYIISATDWDLWDSPQYTESVSKDALDKWVENYTKVIREVSQFAQSENVDVLIIGANPAMVKTNRETDNDYLNSVYEKLLQEMLKEARKWYTGKIGFDFGNIVGGNFIEFKKIPEIGKFDYVVISTSAIALDGDDPFKWTEKTLKAIEKAQEIVEKNNAEGIILGYEFSEFGSYKDLVNGQCKSIQPYALETRKMLYNELINQTKEHVVGYLPITTRLFACDSETILNVTKEWYEKL